MKNLLQSITRFASMLALLMSFALPARAGEWKVDQVVVAIPGNKIEVVDSAGNVIDPGISLGTSGHVGGCAPDSSYRIRCIDYDNKKVVKFALMDPHAPTSTLSLSTANPQSILYVGLNNDFLVGFAGVTSGTVQRFSYGAANNDSPNKTCSSLPVDAPLTNQSPTFWMDIFSDKKKVVYTSGVGNGSKAALRMLDLTATDTKCGAATTFTLKLNSGQAFYGVRAVPTCSLTGCPIPSSSPTFVGTGTVDGSAGYIIDLGSDILRVDSSGNPVKCYISGLTGQVCPGYSSTNTATTNNWRSVWLSSDGNGLWAVNLATGNLFEFNIATGTVVAGSNVPITTSASANDVVGGITVEGAGDAAQPVVQATNFVVHAAAGSTSTVISTFYDPACAGTNPPSTCSTIQPNRVTTTVNGTNLDGTLVDVTANVLITFTEVGQVVGKSDPIPPGSSNIGLICTKESQDGNNCVIFDTELNVTSGGPGTTDFLFFSPYSGIHPTLLWNLGKDITQLISQGTLSLSGGTCTPTHPCSIHTNNELPAGVFVSGGWQSPITDTAGNHFSGGSISTKFTVFDSNGVPVQTSTFGCSTSTPGNCPELSIYILREDAAPTQIFPPQGNTGSSGTADLVFRPGADATTWVVTVDTTNMQPGCYIFTGLDPFDRFAPFSYSTTTAPFTTILRIGTATPGVNDTTTCLNLAKQAGIDAK